jgi:hypothetical protein
VHKIQYQTNNKNNNTAHQEKIGWNKILTGKVALSLSTNIEVHMKKSGYATKYLVKFTQKLRSQWKKAWMERIKISEKHNSNSLYQLTNIQNAEKLSYLCSDEEYLNDNFTKVMDPV